MFSRKCVLPTYRVHKNFQSCINQGRIVGHIGCLRSINANLHYLTGNHHRFSEGKINSNSGSSKWFSNPPVRSLSAKNVFRLTESSASQLQPYLDIESIIKNQEAVQDSINKRHLSGREVKEVQHLFEQAHHYKTVKEKVQQLREENTVQCQELMRLEFDKPEKSPQLKDLKEKGRQLREELRDAENKFNEVNDKLVDLIISLPNILDCETPVSEAELLKEVTPKGTVLWQDPEYTAVETQCGPGLLAEFPIGKTAWLDIDLRGKAQLHLLQGGFIETGNTDFVKRLILQGAGIDHSQCLRIREPNVKQGWEHATYLAGGASFPSFLALFAQSVIEDPNVLPLRYFVIGRSYESQKNKPGFYQSHVVQAFVACRNQDEMNNEFYKLQGLMESFYAEKVGFAFQTQLVPAPRLQMYERKKLAFVMNKTETSPSKMVGTLSVVGDYVSKRLLCCCFDEKRRAQFLHLISAKFFDITHFLRSPNPKLVSHADMRDPVKPQAEVLRFRENDESENQNQA